MLYIRDCFLDDLFFVAGCYVRDDADPVLCRCCGRRRVMIFFVVVGLRILGLCVRARLLFVCYRFTSRGATAPIPAHVLAATLNTSASNPNIRRADT